MSIAAPETRGVGITWTPREPPLEPVGCHAMGAIALSLAHRLLVLSAAEPDRFRRIEGVASPDRIALLGAGDDLPWVDGLTYVGRDPDAPTLLLPTLLAPSVHPALLQQALLRAGGGASRLMVVLSASGPSLVPIDRAATISRSLIERWVASTAEKAAKHDGPTKAPGARL